MKFSKLLMLCLIVIISSCTATKKNTITKIVEIRKQETVFSPAKNKLEIEKNVSVEIEPTNASELNTVFYSYLNKTGQYYSESARESIKTTKESANKKLTAPEKLYINYTEVINKLVNSGEIPATVGELMIKKAQNDLMKDLDYGFDGSESTSTLSTESLKEFNPLIFGERYASIFKLVLSNNGESPVVLNARNLAFITGMDQYEPLSINYFLFNNMASHFFSRTIRSLYMPDSIILFPKTTVVKYVAVPPIDTAKADLSVYELHNNKSIKCNFQVKTNTTSSQRTFQYYTIKMKGVGSSAKYFVNVVVPKNSIPYVLKDDGLFVDEALLNEGITIYQVAYDDFNKIGYIAKQLNCIPGKSVKNEIILLSEKP